MPFNELKRQDSFPPTIVRLSPPSSDESPKPKPNLELLDIDANPISFFLTTPTPEDDEYDTDIDYFDDVFEEDYGAGIEGSEEDLRSKEVREVSPSSLQRERAASSAIVDEVEDVAVEVFDDSPLLSRVDEEEEDDVVFGFAMPLSLKDFTSRPVKASAPRDIVKSGRVSRTGMHSSSPSTSPPLRGLGIDIPDFIPKSKNDRGRGRVKLSPLNMSPVASNRGRRTVSLSPKPRKPVSWRVPSRGIWRIDEMDEEVGVEGLSCSAPALGGAGILRNGGEDRKGKKKQVRWADLEEFAY